MLLKKTAYDRLVAKVNSIDTSTFALKTKYDTDKSELENEIPDTSGFLTNVKKTDYNTKVTEIENKPNNHNHDKHITTPEFNALAADAFNARLSQAYFKIIPNRKYISSWQSKGLSGETIKPPATSDYKLNP